MMLFSGGTQEQTTGRKGLRACNQRPGMVAGPWVDSTVRKWDTDSQSNTEHLLADGQEKEEIGEIGLHETWSYQSALLAMDFHAEADYEEVPPPDERPVVLP